MGLCNSSQNTIDGDHQWLIIGVVVLIFIIIIIGVIGVIFYIMSRNKKKAAALELQQQQQLQAKTIDTPSEVITSNAPKVTGTTPTTTVVQP